MFSGLCVRLSHLRLKFLVQVVWDEVGSPINFKLSIYVPYDMIFLILIPN